MTAFLDWISQQLTTAPLWIQSPIVILGSVLVCVLLAVPLIRITDIIAAWIPRLFEATTGRAPSGGDAPSRKRGATYIISETEPS